jgi:hypothetical protein
MDVAMAAENMMISAFALGIGSCPVLSFDKDKIRDILSVGSHVDLNLLVTFGVAGYMGEAPRRSTAQIFSETMGNAYDGSIREMVKTERRSEGTATPETLKDLISFTIFSAKSLAKEPADYAVFRLVEIAGRLLDSYSKPEELKNYKRLKETLDRIRFGKMIPSEELMKEIEKMVQLL